MVIACAACVIYRIGSVYAADAPFICQTEENGLGKPTDPECNAHTVVQYYYRSTDPTPSTLEILTGPNTTAGSLAPGFKPYPLSAGEPTDVARTVTSDGQAVRFIVRREIGVINRAVYDIQFLHDPGGPLPSPTAQPDHGWNGRLVYLFDGGCGAGYRQGTFTGAIGLATEPFLAQGYATVTSTLNSFANNCNDRVSTETAALVKEHFIAAYGRPTHTMGWGGSGGAMQLYLTAQNSPGLLDGIIPYFGFPDMLTTAQTITDCALLEQAFMRSKQAWTEGQKTAVSGFASWRACSQGWAGFAVADAQKFCPPMLPKALVYDRQLNAHGLKCDIYDNEADVLGRDAWSHVRRPLDNVGVQYGLDAMNAGKISPEQFVELNELVGGFDGDGTVVSARTRADPNGLRIAYERGIVMRGNGGLTDIPIIEWRPYADDLGDNHDYLRSLIVRERLKRANGTSDNHVMLVYPRLSVLDVARFMKTQRWEDVFEKRARDLVRQMDHWLDNIVADHTGLPVAKKVGRDKPGDLSDSCWTTGGERITDPAMQSAMSPCNQLYPSHRDPRLVAGAPGTDDILKCQLKAINTADYRRLLSEAQLRRLRVVFPDGVCDYSQPGVG